MMRLRTFLLSAGLLIGAGCTGVARAAEEPIRFQELFELLRDNLAGAKEADLNRAAVLGLLQQLGPQVSIVGESPAAATPKASGLLSAAVLENSYGYVRLGSLRSDLDKDFTKAFDGLRSTNRLKGLILDLRFAGGQDYSAALALADQFFGSEQPLVDWGEGLKKSTDKTNAVTVPVALLVNRHTTGAAEALAAILRHADVGLVIGTNTAGQASLAKEFTLKSGQRLRVAVAPLKVGEGKELPMTGLKPDIEVEVSPEDERAWYDDAFKAPGRTAAVASLNATNDSSASGTNRTPRRRLNEAELVRMSREGRSTDPVATNAPTRAPEPAPAVVSDPALVRALDLLKGLAVVQQFRTK